MLRTTRYAALLAPLLVSSAALIFGGVAAQADPRAPQIGTTSAVERANPEAGGRVINRVREAATGESSWQGSSAQAKPTAGGRVILASDQAAGEESAWQGSTAQAKPDAGGRVITRTRQVADGAATPQRTSAVTCASEASEPC
jgi:hypothetical protein